MLSTILSGIGLFCTIKIVYPFVDVMIKKLFSSGVPLEKIKDHDSYVLITGCTDGIGLEFSIQLGIKGFNLILIARNENKLNKLKSRIEMLNNKVKIEYFVIDFSVLSEWFQLTKFLDNSSIKVNFLINNVGCNHSFPILFDKEQLHIIEDIIKVNVLNTVKLTRLVTEKMSMDPKKGKKVILNIGSFSGIFPTPYLATYSASKAFLSTFTQAIGSELQDSKEFVVQYFDTYFVQTKMSKIRKSSLMVPTAETYVQCCLNNIGVYYGSKSPYSTTPYLPHAIANLSISLVPESILLWYNKNMHKNIMDRAFRKLERETSQ